MRGELFDGMDCSEGHIPVMDGKVVGLESLIQKL
jgi:hypothetical protein